MRSNGFQYCLWSGLIAVLCLSCSTQKNTGATRAYHAMTTRYNIYFNGNNSFNEGLEAIDKANADDFSQLIPLYPVSNHEAANAATSQMDRTIEKCRKCIKLHSIKKRPQIDQRRRNDPKYQAFLKQREFNKNMADAWILLGKAEFHKGDFLGAVGTFSYIARDYDYDPNVVAQCQLWMARAYAEMGWMYEAEEVLQKVKQDDLSHKHAYLYATTSADIKLKTQAYKEAIPFVKLGLKDETKAEKTRFYYVLGQLYELQNDKDNALLMYKKVVSSNPPAEMDFSARIKLTELSSDIATLTKMAKQYKNRNRLDYIYGALGDIYLQKKDTVKALENYQLAIEGSKQTTAQKGKVLVQAGDLYYQHRQYPQAQPCYTEAMSILSATSPDYPRVSKRSEALDALIVETNMVQLQDSLQHLSTLSEEEQLKVVQQVIADLEKAEQEAAARAEQEARDAQNDFGLQGVNTQNMLGGGGSSDWYFYNPQLIRSGKQTFTQKWGNRPLEDNWRRISKAASPTTREDNDEEIVSTDSVATDSVEVPVSDTKDPQFYLQQIPKTPEALAASDSLIATSLYNLIFIYRNTLKDEPLAQETFDDFRRRFPTEPRLVDLYYQEYLNALKAEDTETQNYYKALILREFPNSNQAAIVSDPNYFARLQHMAQEQDSLYAATYAHYKACAFDSVKLNKQYAEAHYPFSPLMPKLLFLNAIAVAKTEGQTPFVAQLRDMVSRYPQSDVGAMAKDMLAMMNQGMESQTGGTVGTLTEQRTLVEEPLDSLPEQAFSIERNQTASLLLYMQADESTLNELLYQVALFNFSQFLIKDFDLRALPSFGTAQTMALQVLGFDSLDEVEWYQNLLLHNPDLQALFSRLQVQCVGITDSNYALLFHPYSLTDYLDFLAQ